MRAAVVPCNVDADNGYGNEPEDMAAAVERFAATGAGGMGIEDWSGDQEIGLYDRALAIARIEAAVKAARALERPFVITGRTEVLLYGLTEGWARRSLACRCSPGSEHACTRPAREISRRSRRSPMKPVDR